VGLRSINILINTNIKDFLLSKFILTKPYAALEEAMRKSTLLGNATSI
jgi:hypothetical protein